MAATPITSQLSSIDPEPTEPRSRARAARRQALLETAEEVFAERGFSGATMSEIASRAGYSAGNLYNVFEGKDALFTEVVTTRADQVLEDIASALAGGDSLGQIIDRYIDATLAGVEAHRAFFLMLTQTTPDFEWHQPQEQADGSTLRSRIDGLVEGVFESAMARGEIPTGDSLPYACLLHGTLNAHVARWVRNRGSREELWGPVPELRRLIRKALGVPESS